MERFLKKHIDYFPTLKLSRHLVTPFHVFLRKNGVQINFPIFLQYDSIFYLLEM